MGIGKVPVEIKSRIGNTRKKMDIPIQVDETKLEPSSFLKVNFRIAKASFYERRRIVLETLGLIKPGEHVAKIGYDALLFRDIREDVHMQSAQERTAIGVA